MFKINDDNYDHYKKIYQVICKYELSLVQVSFSNEYTPDNILADWEKKSKSLAKRVLKEGLRDILTVAMINMSSEMKNELNHQLTSQDLPSLNQLVSAIKDTPQKVLKRGKISNLDEYYIIKEYLDDLMSEISDTDREKLNTIFVNFETTNSKKKSNI